MMEFSVKTLMVFEKGFSSTSFEKYLKALFAGGFCRQPPAPPPAADVFFVKIACFNVGK